jgi:hypothetical protein
MSITLDGIELPDDLNWSDETAPWKVAQTATPTLSGALVIQESAMQVGRPITLESQQDGAAWVAMVPRATVDALLAKEAVAGAAAMTLTVPRYDGSTASYQVRWRRTDGPAIEAKPMKFIVPAAPTDWYSLTLRLVQV